MLKGSLGATGAGAGLAPSGAIQASSGSPALEPSSETRLAAMRPAKGASASRIASTSSGGDTRASPTPLR